MTTTLIGLTECPACGCPLPIPTWASSETAVLIDPTICPGCSMGPRSCPRKVVPVRRLSGPERRLPTPRSSWT